MLSSFHNDKVRQGMKAGDKMRAAKNGSSPAVMFFLSVLFFAVSVAAGMFAAYHMGDELYETLAQYVNSALGEKIGFKKVFVNAVKSDFRYTVLVLVSSLSVFSSFVPLLMTGFKGFSSGLAVAVASRAIEMRAGSIAFSVAVFLSCVFTVPVYVLMFMLCFKFALRNRKSSEPFGIKAKNYMEFSVAVMMLFAVLCIIDCLQAVSEPVLCSFAV